MKTLSIPRWATNSPALKPTLLIVLSIFIIFGSLFFRAQLAVNSNLIGHDDAISLLSATGHQAEYQRNIQKLSGVWLVGEELKYFITVEDAGIFTTIRDDLIATDIHPPLYFWLLHIWFLIFPTGKIAGPILNILIFIGTSFLLYKVSKLALCSTPNALAVVAIFAASPVAVDITLFTRQYELWMFWSTALLYIGIRFFTQRKESVALDTFLLFTVLLLGMLTHYYFAITALSIYAAATFLHQREDRRKFAMFIAAAIAAALFFLVLLPDFPDQLQRQQVQKQAFDVSEIFPRFHSVVEALLHFIGWRPWWPTWPAIIITIAVLSPILFRGIKRRQKFLANSKHPTPEKFVWYSLAIGSGLVFILYILQFAPKHAMGSRYIAGVTPMLALAIGLILQRITRFHSECLAAFSVLLAANSFVLYQNADRDTAFVDYVRSASNIIVDNMARGFLFSLVVEVPEETRVFAAWRADLISSPELWIDELREGDLLSSRDGYENDGVSKSLLIDLVSKKYEVTRATEDLWVVEGAKLP